ncbi:cupin domain-containing protein [Geodermatophilus sp. SYSU D00079]
MSDPTVPLASHLWLQTADLDEVRERLGQVLRPHRLRVVRGGPELRVVHHLAELGSTAFHYVDHDADVQVSAEELGFVLVQIPLAGRAVVRAGRDEVVATPEVAAVSGVVDAPSFEYHAPNPRLMIRIDAALLESRLALALGDRPRRPVRFDPSLDLTSPGGRSWRRLVDTIVADVDSGGPSAGHRWPRHRWSARWSTVSSRSTRARSPSASTPPGHRRVPARCRRRWP